MSGDEFIVTRKEDSQTVTVTVRMEAAMQNKLEELARQSNRSRNELILMALEYALKNVKFVNNAKNDK
ncbi:CopG family transcriptional regulator [Paenibacillus hemerocallicola]|jgi:predicted transcriptional regulator|uniref:CopG family transcriptional regulator n=1 Tax=Paenibacillus hemerocallicola TaxID=1172614 RepID=A0A5C4T2F8_9BACL|nr:ribbon-helix-helix protein, CopG family [Paenibacillus hemerocallicola]TNJ63203.1 CopG family transcriptional regulator [Paenibacillus hemerocallicola]